jgi:hypothetical protein
MFSWSVAVIVQVMVRFSEPTSSSCPNVDQSVAILKLVEKVVFHVPTISLVGVSVLGVDGKVPSKNPEK